MPSCRSAGLLLGSSRRSPITLDISTYYDHVKEMHQTALTNLIFASPSQNLPSGRQGPAGAPGREDPVPDQAPRRQRGGAAEAPGRVRTGPAQAPGRLRAGPDGGPLQEDPGADQGHRPVKSV